MTDNANAARAEEKVFSPVINVTMLMKELERQRVVTPREQELFRAGYLQGHYEGTRESYPGNMAESFESNLTYIIAYTARINANRV